MRSLSELYNNSTNRAFDLSGWQFKGLSYTFPDGSTIAPNKRLVLAANNAAFAAAYGATNPVFDVFEGTLSANGETLTLNLASNVAVAKVKFSNQLPWPTNCQCRRRFAAIDGSDARTTGGLATGRRFVQRGAARHNGHTSPRPAPLRVPRFYIYLQSAGDVYSGRHQARGRAGARSGSEPSAGRRL